MNNEGLNNPLGILTRSASVSPHIAKTTFTNGRRRDDPGVS